MRSRSAPSFSIAATVASITPVSAPRHPAWAAPITRASRVGQQHRPAVGGRDADGEAGRTRVTMASARGRSLAGHGVSATTTVGEWIW